jgi:hypothetical protein
MAALPEAFLEEGNYTPRERALLQALYPFARIAGMDGVVPHIKALFAGPSGDEIGDAFDRARRVYAKATGQQLQEEQQS